MFRLEKVFQNDDSGYILFSNSIKSLILLATTYIFVILSDNSIYELTDFDIFKSSNFFFLFYIIINHLFYNFVLYK